jgi:ABC-2 type transport system permease protein
MRRFFPEGFRYEFKRSLFRTSTAFIILVSVFVAIASATQVAANPPGAEKMYSAGLFYSDGAYHFEFYAFNQYGSPLSGVNYTVNVTAQSSNTRLANLTGETEADGLVELSTSLPAGAYVADIDAGPQNRGEYWAQGATNGSVDFGPLYAEEVVPLLSPLTAAVNLLIGFSGELALQVFYPAPNEACERGCPVFFALTTDTSGATPLPESSMTSLGTLQSSIQTFSLSIPPRGNSSVSNIQLEIFSPSGALLAMDTNCPASSFNPYQIPDTIADVAFTPFGNDLGLLVPLLAIVLAFAVYARDRVSGVLESTLVQPLTQRSLAMSRLLAVVVTLLLALAIGMILSDELIHLLVGYFLLPSYFLSFYLGSAIVIMFFVGIVFALSHLLRSTAPLIATSAGAFLWFYLLWGVVVSSIEVGSQALYVGTEAAAALQVGVSFFNPIQFSGLLLTGVTDTTPGVAAQYGGSAESWGVTPVALAVAAAAWILIPVVLLLWRIRTAD